VSIDKGGRPGGKSGNGKRTDRPLSADLTFEDFVAGIAQVKPNVRAQPTADRTPPGGQKKAGRSRKSGRK